MTAPAAGWYPDPAGSGGQRWWDGSTWGEQVQPAGQPAQPAVSGQPWGGQPGQPGPAGAQQWSGAPGAQQWGGAPEQPPATFAKANKLSLIALALVVVCVVIAMTTHYIVFAFIPLFVAISAVQAKERLAWPALGVAAALAIWRFIA